jgi:carbonic anhydrase
MTGDEALARLLEGNRRFVAERAAHPNQSGERRQEIARGQLPFAILLGCSDSRVPLEIIFDQGLGDLFVVRVAGNVVDDSVVLGTIEFAVAQFQCPLLLVLGHEKCGAVQAAHQAITQEAMPQGALASIVKAIEPAIIAAQDKGGDEIDFAIRANALHIAEQLRNADAFLQERNANGELKIAAAYYALETGTVELLME